MRTHVELHRVRRGAAVRPQPHGMVSGNFFSGLGARMHSGRGFTVAEETEHAQSAVVGHGFWTR